MSKTNKVCYLINRSAPENDASLASRFSRTTSDSGDEGFDESTALELDNSIAKANAIRLLDAIISGNRVEILDAAINMTKDDAMRLRLQIHNQRATSTPVDKAVMDAANFAVEIIERNEILNPVHVDKITVTS